MNIREKKVNEHEAKRKKLFEGIEINDKFLKTAGIVNEEWSKAPDRMQSDFENIFSTMFQEWKRIQKRVKQLLEKEATKVIKESKTLKSFTIDESGRSGLIGHYTTTGKETGFYTKGWITFKTDGKKGSPELKDDLDKVKAAFGRAEYKGTDISVWLEDLMKFGTNDFF